MRELFNLIVDLNSVTLSSHREAGASSKGETNVCIENDAVADDRTLAWIDDVFGGAWSSEAHAGSNVLALRDGAPVGFATYDPKGLKFAWLRGLAREPGVGVFGPIGVAQDQRGTGLGKELLHRALAALRARGYERALIPAVGSPRLIQYYSDAAGATVAERFDGVAWASKRPRVVVMASGSGTNLQAVLDSSGDGVLPIEIAAVVCNNPDAYAIERARNAHVAVEVLPWRRTEESRDGYDERLLAAVRAYEPDLVLLLGWMHLLAEPFVGAFAALLNLHPAFLPLDPQRDDVGMPDGTSIPAFRGAHAVRDALAAGSAWTGATVHAVTPSTDRGPVLVRKPLRLEKGENEPAVMSRLHPLEHRVVASAIVRWIYERSFDCAPSALRSG